ncbi:GIY-YIG nuclease family protein [Prosthecobacter sp.]|uniref:GIY-YIG nuclease family protein n=1 Tax=Prosthecobacter sp. TaxID=1965333 RepID=UPI003784C64C
MSFKIANMYYVYLLRSQSAPRQTYTGFTEDLRQRLAEYNSGKSPHTSHFTPWLLETYLAFSDRSQAQAFERYLKTASGTAFANKRLRNSSSPPGGRKCPP